MNTRRIVVRRSGVHGKGVFAVAPIAAGERVVEYKGERISWKEALERHPHDPEDPNHTFYFALEGGDVIDGKVGGNSARWINHACAPNCEAEETAGRVFIRALRDIAEGEELFYDYGLIIDAKMTGKLKREYACRCGANTCRGTLLAAKQAEVSGKKDKKKKKKKKAKAEAGVGKSGKARKVEKAETTEKAKKAGKVKKAGKFEKAAKAGKADKAEKAEKSGKAATAEEAERGAPAEPLANADVKAASATPAALSGEIAPG
ncbi:MAG: hypothetical protein GAK40_01072 [Burkholderia plantarii]|nr:MAG: hypothetical protein GAK40_01072 [Burkholderia plantarii]